MLRLSNMPCLCVYMCSHKDVHLCRCLLTQMHACVYALSYGYALLTLHGYTCVQCFYLNAQVYRCALMWLCIFISPWYHMCAYMLFHGPRGITMCYLVEAHICRYVISHRQAHLCSYINTPMWTFTQMCALTWIIYVQICISCASMHIQKYTHEYIDRQQGVHT